MENSAKDFLNKIMVNTYIYTFTFIAVAVGYSLKNSIGVEPGMLLLAAFAFYTLGRQVRLAMEIDSGVKADNMPKARAWVRGVTFLVVMLLAFSLFFV
jgi:hypothetical protein